MNKEQQYRTGRMAEVDPIPTWVYERVDEVVEQKDRTFDVISQARRVMRELSSKHSRLVAARKTLGITAETPCDGLLSYTQSLVNSDPAREAEYWEAMWIAREPAQLQDEYRRLLPSLAQALELRQYYGELGWPDKWLPKFCLLWQELGGTPDSARAWARAGWAPEDAMTQHAIINGRNASIEVRVAHLHPPVFVPSARTGWVHTFHSYSRNMSSEGSR